MRKKAAKQATRGGRGRVPARLPAKGRAVAGVATAAEGGGKPIAAVERALLVLSAFRSTPCQTLSELSRRTGLFKSTLLRILGTLERHGYVTRLEDGNYRVGGILFELGSRYVESFQLAEIMRPALASLSTMTGESAAFYMRAGAQRQCIFRVDSPQSVRAVIVAGQILDLDDAATSRIFRAYANSSGCPSASAVQYAALCEATAGIGDPLTASVAAPIFATGGFLGVMTLSGPVNRFTEDDVVRFRAVLAAIAAKVSIALGGVAAGEVPDQAAAVA